MAFYEAVREKGISKKSVAKQLKLLSSPKMRAKLLLELACNMDIAPTLIVSITFLEGDGFLAAYAYHVFVEVQVQLELFVAGVHPNVDIIATKISVFEHPEAGPARAARKQELITYGEDCVRPS